MKLTKHQQAIISKIIAGEVYDIPSYLRAFNKGRLRKYDLGLLRERFISDENGSQYKVMKEGHSLFKIKRTDHSPYGLNFSFPELRTSQDVSDDEWEYKEAQFIDTITPATYEYQEQKFTFDFGGTGVFIADAFDDIIDFISLWSYMQREALVLELDKPLSADEISISYELVPKQTKSKSPLTITYTSEKTGSLAIDVSSADQEFFDEPPQKHALWYATEVWKINEDHLVMCHDFIGKKIYPTSALRAYAAHKYKTADEVDQKRNLWIAAAALIISIISPIVSMFLPQPTYYEELAQIQQSMTVMQEDIAALKTSQITTETLEPILTAISEIELHASNLPATDDVDSILSDIAGIRLLLNEYLQSNLSAESDY